MTTSTKPTTSTDTKHSSGSLNTTIADDVTIDEHLSALLDDEAGSFEQKRVLNELSDNDRMRNKLASYSLIGETLRSGHSAAITATGTRFLSGIQDQLAAEDTYSDPVLQSQQNESIKTSATKNDSSWLRPLGGFAMAASVAALAVIGFQNYSVPTTNSVPTNSVPTNNVSTEIVATNTVAPLNSTQDTGNTNPVLKDKLTEAEMESAIVVTADQLQDSRSVDATQYIKANLKTRSMLKRYVDSHMQYASTTSFIPSVRAITYSDF